MVKELFHFFCPSAFDRTFGRHQESCSFELTVEFLLFCINKNKLNINKIAFNKGTDILNIFNN